MAERHPREEALRRVHGPGALFAAAYGNVGSSIYYALGLVALYALGLTPVTFMIAGPDLRLHRRDLRRGDRALPGGRRLVELRPPRLQRARLLPRGRGRRCSPTSSRRRSRPSSSRTTWRSSGSRSATARRTSSSGSACSSASRRSTSRAPRSRPGSTWCSRSPTSRRRRCSSVIGCVLVLDPELLVNQVHLGTAPTCGDFLLGIAVGMVAYTGIETISNMSEEARVAEPLDPARDRGRRARGGRPLRVPAVDRALGDAGHPGRRRALHDRARDHLRRRPGARDRREPRPSQRAHRRPARLRRRARRR